MITVLIGPGMTSAPQQSLMAADESDGQRSGFNALENHQHAEIHVDSRPVVERIPVDVIEPVDIRVTVDGAILVADAQANSVFRIHPKGHSELLATELGNLRRLCVDAVGGIYAMTSDSATGGIHQITRTGYTAALYDIPFAAAGFARNATGEFAVIARNSGRVGLFNDLTGFVELPRLPETAIDIATNSSDQFVVLLESGRVIYLGSAGSRSLVGLASEHATRLFKLPDGQMATLNKAVDQKQSIQKISFGAATDGTVVAHVPQGTNAIAFDELGNLCLCNPNLRAITKVTSTFVIPCPHCQQSVRMIFSPKATGADEVKQRGSF